MLAITSQTIYVCGVHRIIRELLRLMVPNLVENSTYIRSDAEFRARIESAMIEATTPATTESEYIHAIVNAASMEMKDLCEALKASCHFVGLGRIAADYLDARRFREMLLRKDEEKLERINEIVRAREGKPIKILMDVAKVLNDNAGIYDEMEASAKRKAAAELKKVVENVTSIVTEAKTQIVEKIDEGNTEIVSRVEEVGGKVDAVGKKVDRLRLKGKRRSKHGEAAREACLTCWEMAQSNAEVRYAINTRITYTSVFTHFSRQLAKHGIVSAKQFRTILHAAQSLESSRRIKALEAKREAERKRKARKR